jgi:hypothetical protein
VEQQPPTDHDAPNANQNDKQDVTTSAPTTKVTTNKEPNKYAKTLSSVGYATNHHDPTTLGKQTT